MEKLIEQLVKEIAVQNKLTAIQIAKSLTTRVEDACLNREQNDKKYYTYVPQIAENLLLKVYTETY